MFIHCVDTVVWSLGISLQCYHSIEKGDDDGCSTRRDATMTQKYMDSLGFPVNITVSL